MWAKERKTKEENSYFLRRKKENETNSWTEKEKRKKPSIRHLIKECKRIQGIIKLDADLEEETHISC